MDQTPPVQSDLLELAPYECWQLLDQPVRIARIVWTVDGAAAIVPVNYAVADGSLWFRTTPASRLAQECPGRQVLVEIDSLDPVARSGWSVIVTGKAESVDALEVPDILGGLQVWPRGDRPLFLRVTAEHVSGRRLRSPY
jgi:hypothetical protein